MCVCNKQVIHGVRLQVESFSSGGLDINERLEMPACADVLTKVLFYIKYITILND